MIAVVSRADLTIDNGLILSFAEITKAVGSPDWPTRPALVATRLADKVFGERHQTCLIFIENVLKREGLKFRLDLFRLGIDLSRAEVIRADKYSVTLLCEGAPAW